VARVRCLAGEDVRQPGPCGVHDDRGRARRRRAGAEIGETGRSDLRAGWLVRLLSLAALHAALSGPPDAVILEGVATPGFGFANYSADAACSEHLGVRGLLGSLLLYEWVRGAIAPLVYRAKRCSPADVSAILHLSTLLFGGTGGISISAPSAFAIGVRDDSRALFYQIALAEFWNATSPTVATADTELRGLFTATDLTLDMARRATMWPAGAASADDFNGKSPTFTRPLLMLEGALDPATPAKYASKMRDRFQAPFQNYVLFPDGAHDPSYGTYTSAGKSCGLSILAAFVENPKARSIRRASKTRSPFPSRRATGSLSSSSAPRTRGSDAFPS
jgi:hypothetical protein